MHILEVFYDYTCPFCLKGHELLREVILKHPEIEISWRPCELSPQKSSIFGDPGLSPKRGSYSSLPIRGFYFARENGVDLWAYNDLIYHAVHRSNVDIRSADALAEVVTALLDKEDFRDALKSGAYMKELEEGNDYAYDKNGVWAVPAFRMDGRELDSRLGIGVSKKQLEEFLDTTL